jgi:predicted N-acetyltransferase YhbS
VADEGGARLGLGRLVPVGPGAVELGGIYVVPDRRGHGVAAAIVRELLGRTGGRRVYCVPFASLAEYYKGFGFVDAIAGDPVPEPVHRKLAFCSRYPQGVVLLVMP